MKKDNDPVIELIEKTFGETSEEREKSVKQYNRQNACMTKKEKEKMDKEFIKICDSVIKTLGKQK